MSKKVERVVTHKKLYLAVGGKLQHVPFGSKVSVTEEQAERLGKKLSDVASSEAIETDEGEKTGEKKPSK